MQKVHRRAAPRMPSVSVNEPGPAALIGALRQHFGPVGLLARHDRVVVLADILGQVAR